MNKLLIISSSTRPGRKGPLVLEWVRRQVEQFGDFDIDAVDLGELNLPLMDEAELPAKGEYRNEHTKLWSARVDAADAFILITAEYNFNYPAPLKNALDYVYREWNNKPAAIVSYGGVSGGLRAFNRLKGDLPAYRIFPLATTISFQFFEKSINDQGIFDPGDRSVNSMKSLLDDLSATALGMKQMREYGKRS